MERGKRFTEASVAKVSSVENRLSGLLSPITPSKEFIHGLGRRIRSANRATIVKQIASWRILALLFAGFVSLAIFLVMVARTLFLLLGKKRVAQEG